MDLDEITQILNLMREHELAEFELERDQVKLRLRKHAPATLAAGPPPAALYPPAAGVVPPQPTQPSPPVLAPVGEDLDLAIVKSPIVGTFYSASEPGAKPFVEVGHRVRQGEVLCIIEAMKLMNEINAECDGELMKVYVENGQAVQYGERLFAIKPTTAQTS